MKNGFRLLKGCLLLLLPVLMLSSPVWAAEYRLGIQDKLRINVFEWPALTGEFVVGPAGSISLPLVGEVPAVGLTPAELGTAVADRLAARNPQRPRPGVEPERFQVSVEVTQFRPFYILGVVSRPGDYPYRPGMLVLHAVSIAGGMYRAADVGLARLEKDSISARGELRQLALKRRELLARQARLQAELADRDTITFPPELLKTEQKQDLAVLDEEKSILASRRQALQGQIAMLKQSIVQYRKEIDALNGQIESQKGLMQSVMKEFLGVRSLVEKGLAPAPRQLAIERSITQIQGDLRELDTLILRAQQNINLSEQKILDLQDQRRNTILTELRQTNSDLGALSERTETVEGLVFEAEVIAPQNYNERFGEQRMVASYVIVRQDRDGPREIDATETTPLEPGDIVKVAVSRADRPAPAVSYNESALSLSARRHDVLR